MANGTDAIYITLKALGIASGDEVITTAFSWISTAEAISNTGARPVFVDIDPDYYNIKVSEIENKITKRTRAVLVVHLYGQPAPLDKINSICKNHNIYLIEDCAQAHFARYNKQIVGTFGIAGTFSFYPSKNLGAYGDAGAIITNDDILAKKIRIYANHGVLNTNQHGINSRMDGIQGAILSVKLNYILKWNKMRYENALKYNKLLKGLVTPKIRDDHVFNCYVIRVRDRDGLKDYLNKKGISTAIHYPSAIPFSKAYDYLNHSTDDFPICYKYQGEVLSLPIFPELTDEMISLVVDHIHKYYAI